MPQEYLKTFKTNSIDGWTRDIVISDDFETDLHAWRFDLSGASTAVIDTVFSFKGTGSLLLTTGAISGNRAGIFKVMPGIRRELMMLAFAMRVGNQGNYHLDVFPGLSQAETITNFFVGMKIFVTTGPFRYRIQIQDNGVMTDVATDLSYSFAEDMIWVELLFNLRTLKYVSLKIGGKLIDLSDRVVKTNVSSATSIDPQQFNLIFNTDENVANIMNIDRLFLTNIIEPPITS